MWVDLTYDKYLGTHIFNNEFTRDLQVDNLKDFTYYTENEALELYNTKFNNFNKLHKYILDTNIFKLHVYIFKYNKDIDGCLTIISVNTDYLYDCLINNYPIKHINFIKQLCTNHIEYNIATKYSQNIDIYGSDLKEIIIRKNKYHLVDKYMLPVNYIEEDKIEDLNEIKIKLYDYQKANIKWMINIENNIKEIDYNIKYDLDLDKIYFDRKLYELCIKKDSNKLKFYGGGIIDEVGLGKTIQIIALGLINKLKKQEISENKIISKATLILCPNQLCGQWNREFDKMVNTKLKIITLITKRDFDKYTYQDLIEADFVIVSFNYLTNPNIIKSWILESGHKTFSLKKEFNSDIIEKLSNFFNNNSINLVKNINTLNTIKNCQIQYIKWHRLVIDEFHEIIDNENFNYINKFLPFIESNYRWILTATPFNKYDNLNEIINYLTFYRNIYNENIYTSDTVCEYLYNNCLRRNTKSSVINEYKLPDIKEHIKWLKFSTTERTMYNAYLTDSNNNKFDVFLRQLCCHPGIVDELKYTLSNCKTLKEIEKHMTTHYKKEVNIYEQHYNEIVDKINIVNEGLNIIKQTKSNDEHINVYNTLVKHNIINNDIQINNIITVKNLSEIINKLLLKQNEIKKILDGKKSTLTFFSNVIMKLNEKNNKETCSICLSEINEDNIGVTKCGHIYCYDCLKMSMTTYNNCPLCKSKLTENDIFMLSYTNNNNNKEDELVNEIGTKLANVIKLIKEINDKIIIFSQWDNLLIKISDILKNNGIKNITCKGNVFKRDKCLRDFNNDNDIKVIMLSSDSCASGTNLTCASNIIFLDPIYGDYKYRKNQERQAIGRAYRLGQTKNINIYRFIIKDSVEEEIYNLNQLEDQNK